MFYSLEMTEFADKLADVMEFVCLMHVAEKMDVKFQTFVNLFPDRFDFKYFRDFDDPTLV